jgi:hypothetical protein
VDGVRLRNPYEILFYILSVLVNLWIVGLILAGALLLGYLNALAGEPLSGPTVNTIRVAFVALLLLVPGLVVYRQLTRAGIRGSAVRLSRRQFPDIYAVKEDFARRLRLKREPEIYLMSGNGVLNAFAASTFGYDFVVIHSELFSNTYEKNRDAFGVHHRTRTRAPAAWAHEAVVPAFDRVRRPGSPTRGFPLAGSRVVLRPARRLPGAAGRGGAGVAGGRTIRLQAGGHRGAAGAGPAIPGVLADRGPATPVAPVRGAPHKGPVRSRLLRSCFEEPGKRGRNG